MSPGEAEGDSSPLEEDLDALATRLSISREAAELHRSSDVIDLHLDTYIWTRILGYDLTRRHGLGLLRGRWFHQADLPRAIEGGLTGATWSITTNFLPNADERVDHFAHNSAQLRAILNDTRQARVVTSYAEYLEARRAGLHGAFLGVQGGNALDRAPYDWERLADGSILRVTLLHLTNSALGTTSSPLSGPHDGGLTDRGRAFVEALDHHRVFVDLAHASVATFWGAVDVHDPSRPLLVTHTGVNGVRPHWRNLDDEQLRAIADSGGTIGVMLQSRFLGDPRHADTDTVVDHLAHIVDTVGDDHASIGTDFDGWVRPPKGLKSCAELPRLTDAMLRRGWSAERAQKILGQNFLRAVRSLRD